MLGFRSPVLVVGVASAALLIACSGADDSELFDDVASTESTSATDPVSSDPVSADNEDQHAHSAQSQDPPQTAAAPPSTPTPEETPATSPPPPPACGVEAEPNDNAARATSFTSCVTATLASNKDVDSFRIVAPANAKKMVVTHQQPEAWHVQFRVGRDLGFPIPVVYGPVLDNKSATSAIAVSGGAAYILRASANGNGGKDQSTPYEISVAFE